MIICSRESANSLISDDKNFLSKDDRNKDILNYEVKEIKHGRGVGTENLTDAMRQLIAEDALVSGKTIEEVAKDYGVSPQSVSAYKHAATSTSTYNQPNEALAPIVGDIKSQIKEEAQNKILSALIALNPDKIAAAKARDIASIAKDMSSVVRNLTDDGPLIQNNTVLVYKPRVKEEDDYQIIEARE